MDEPTATPRRSERIARAIEQSMLAGRINPGDRLPSERELMARFGAGRGTVREALYTLRRMGLVSLSPGERAFATRPTAERLVGELGGTARQLLASPEGVRQFQHARRLMERMLAREAALHASPEQLRELLAACEAHRTAVDPRRAVEADLAFHFGIARVCRNPVIAALHGASLEWLREQRSTSLKSAGAKDDAARAHRRIYDAIAARDPDAADRAMEAHLAEVESHYWRADEPALPAAGPTPRPRSGSRAHR